MTAIETLLSTARHNLATVDSATRSTIQTAHHAFGGHISKGLLKRARSASDKRNVASTKYGRAELFERMAKLPNLCGYRVTADDWNELSEIIYKMIVWADLGDRYDYHSASREWSCYPKLEAARHFVERYAGSRVKKQLSTILHKLP